MASALIRQGALHRLPHRSTVSAIPLRWASSGSPSALEAAAAAAREQAPAAGRIAPATSAAPPKLDRKDVPTQTQRAEKAMQRFWKDVGISKADDGQWQISLDKRPLRTPGKKPLRIPPSKLPTAILVAREWDEQKKILHAHSLPMTSLTARALDGLDDPAERVKVIDGLLKFLDTDTICFHEPAPKALVELQNSLWLPLLKWVNETYGVDVKAIEGVLGGKQSAQAKAKLRQVVDGYDAWHLAAFERAVHSTKSFIIGLALVEGHLTVEQASDASRVEVLSQIARWGEVEDTHDVDFQDIRSRLGSAACLLIDVPPVQSSTPGSAR